MLSLLFAGFFIVSMAQGFVKAGYSGIAFV
jgi:hypothetical protein